jgi:hypothetical protein
MRARGYLRIRSVYRHFIFGRRQHDGVMTEKGDLTNFTIEYRSVAHKWQAY